MMSGLCPICGDQPAVPGENCNFCRRQGTLVTTLRRTRLRKYGFCIACGDAPASQHSLCEPCRSKRKSHYQKQREVLLQRYGGRCVRCDESDQNVLELDHINNDGSMHRNQIGSGPQAVFYWAVANNFPDTIQLLCGNCHVAKTWRPAGVPLSKRREKLIKGYGGRCANCHETEPNFLELDHVNNDGAAHRRELGGKQGVDRWAIKNGFPDRLQLLCANCHEAKTRTGDCTYRKNRVRATSLN